MKAMSRSREEGDKHSGLMKLVQVLSILVVFVAGIIIGLATSPHFNRYFSAQSEVYSFMNQAVTYNIPEHVNESCTIVKTCEKVDCLSMETYLHPNLNNLSHGMSDEELFWRASMVPAKEEVPYERVPKVAFMFLTRGPLPLLPLWEQFFKGHEKLFSIYVHSLPGNELNVSATSAFYKRQIPSKKVEWGTIGLVDAEKRLLANALLDFSNERFVLLSESCIPIFNFPTVYKYLTNSLHSFADLFDERSRYGRGRYSRHMYPDIKLHQWRKGSQWFELNRAVAIHVVSETKYYNIFKRHCTPACYPDEHYIATYLNMFHGSLNANRTVTWVDWSRGGPHPATYGRENVTEGFIRNLRTNQTKCTYNYEMTSTCYLFARKFSPGALEPLLNLTRTVMEF